MKILITTFGSLGDLFPYLNIARPLMEAGHFVTIATNDQHRERVEAAGHQFRSMHPHVADNAEFFRRAMDEWTGSRYLLQEVLLPAVRDAYRDLLGYLPGHDLFITHPATFAGPLVARATGIPWISTVLAPLSFFSDADPPVIGYWLRYFRGWSPRVTAAINRWGKREVIRWTADLRQFQEELGQGGQASPVFEGQHSPRKVVALFSRHFAPPQPDWPSQTEIAGFPFAPAAGLPEEVERFLAAGAPPIVVTLGSSAVLTPGRFFEFVRQLGHRALLLAGPNADSIPKSKDILAVEYAPHSAVFPHASAIVHQGGIGTTAEVLRSGRPSLTVPFAHDQPDNACRLERLGVGRVMSRRSLSVKNLRREVEELLSHSRYAEAARDLGDKIRAEPAATLEV